MRGSMKTCALAVLLSLPAAASSQPAPPPLWLAIHREVVKPGKEAAHAKLEVAWARALEAAKYQDVSLGLGSMTGAQEMWWLAGYPSLDGMQKSNAAYDASAPLAAVEQKFRPQEADYLNNATSMIARYRDDLSYSNGDPMTSMRYMLVTRITLKIGHGDEFTEARKLIKAAHEKSKATDGYAIYQVTAGAPAGTYLLLQGRKSLAELDSNPHGPAYIAALGGPEGQKKLTELLIAYQNAADTNLFQVNPEISVVPKAWADADPYWKPKPIKVAAKP